MPPQKAGPALYPELRENALAIRFRNLDPNAVHAVLMDWHPGPDGTVSVLAGADGAASIYLSSGGGFIGGGQSSPALHKQAQDAVAITQHLFSRFQPATTHDLPPAGTIFFYATTHSGVWRGSALEADLRSGKSPLSLLGNCMQTIVTTYRTQQQPPPRS